MVNNISDGISVKLHTVFGGGYKIYTSNVEQGLEEPCFFIKTLKPINTPLLQKRKKREYPFDIHYFPENDADNESMLAVGERLMESLEYISLLNGDLVRGKDMSYEIIDRVLHFGVTYAVTLNDISREDSMNSYGLKMGVKK